MKHKTLWILCAAFVLVMAVAALLYNGLADRVQSGGLVTEPPIQTTAPVEETAAQTQPTEATQPQRETVPDVVLLNWQGEEVNLSDFFGKPIVLNFWASWCGPCKMEMPDFQKAYEAYGEEIHFLMVNCTGGRETVESAKAFIEESGYSFPVYFDTTYEAAALFGASSIPLTYFIDADGFAVAYGQGALDGETLQRGIDMIYTAE